MPRSEIKDLPVMEDLTSNEKRKTVGGVVVANYDGIDGGSQDAATTEMTSGEADDSTASIRTEQLNNKYPENMKHET